MQATPECFAHLTQLLQVLAGGRVCAVLEVIAAGREDAGPEAEGQREGSGHVGQGILPGPVTPLSCGISASRAPGVATTWSPSPRPCA